MTRVVFDQVVLDCRSQAPLEACGMLSSPFLLAGQAVTLDGFHPMANVSDHPRYRFEFDSETLIDLYGELETVQRMPRVVYHSHPDSPAYPSDTDVRYAADESKLWHLIVSLSVEPVVRLFEIRRGIVTQQPFEVVDEIRVDRPPVSV